MFVSPIDMKIPAVEYKQYSQQIVENIKLKE